jgi:hypothetical protein
VDKKTKEIVYIVSLGILFFVLSLVTVILTSPPPLQIECPPCPNLSCSKPPCVCSMACSPTIFFTYLISALLLVYGAYIIIAAVSYIGSLKSAGNKPKLLLFAKSLFICALIGFCLIILAPSVLGYMLELVALLIKPNIAQEIKIVLSGTYTVRFL